MFRSRKTTTSDSSRETLLKQRRRGSTTGGVTSVSKVKQSALNQNQSGRRQHHGATVSKEPKVRTIREVDDEDLNSGFGSYMRSGEGKIYVLF